MNLSIILLSQTVTEAVITIIALLVFAAIIGYATAWFYSRSIYTPKINSLKNENDGLIKRMSAQKEEISKLNGKIDKLNEKIVKLEGETVEKDKSDKKTKKEKKKSTPKTD